MRRGLSVGGWGKVRQALPALLGLFFLLLGLPGHIEDSNEWLRWLATVTAEGWFHLTLAIAFFLLAAYPWWWPRLSGTHEFRKLGDRIDEIMHLDEQGASNLRTTYLKRMALYRSLDKLQIPHPDLNPLGRRTGIFLFLLRYLVTEGTLKAARSLWSRIQRDFDD